MPRNEFKAGDEEDPEIDAIMYVDNVPYAVVHKFHPGKDEAEASDQEVEPVEVDPHMWPEETRVPTLAELRKSHRSVTEAHIAGPATSED